MLQIALQQQSTPQSQSVNRETASQGEPLLPDTSSQQAEFDVPDATYHREESLSSSECRRTDSESPAVRTNAPSLSSQPQQRATHTPEAQQGSSACASNMETEALAGLSSVECSIYLGCLLRCVQLAVRATPLMPIQ